jgi:hypothetical protein
MRRAVTTMLDEKGRVGSNPLLNGADDYTVSAFASAVQEGFVDEARSNTIVDNHT